MKNQCSDCQLAGAQVLITGGLGFIGSNIAHKMVEAGAKVTIFDCLDPHSGGNIKNVDNIKNDVSLCFNDILNFDRISDAVFGKDIIINCAASTSHSTSMREPWLDQSINSKGMINILEAIRRFNYTCKFIHLGTTTQIGKLHYTPADENHPEFPTDIYSANKAVAEKYTLIYANAYDLDATVLRISNVFGPRASIHSPEFTFNNFFIGLALQDKPITIFGDGLQKRNVIYVDDVVEAITLIALSGKKTGKDVFFLTGDSHYSVETIGRLTVDIIGSGEIKLIPWPKGRKQIDVGLSLIHI